MSYRLGNGCSGNGFWLSGCKNGVKQKPFLLKPYEYHSFDLSFTSDCAASFSSDYLYVEAILGNKLKKKRHTMKMPIKASVSSSLLPHCANAYVAFAYGPPSLFIQGILIFTLAWIGYVLFLALNRFKKVSQPLITIPEIKKPAKIQHEGKETVVTPVTKETSVQKPNVVSSKTSAPTVETINALPVKEVEAIKTNPVKETNSTTLKKVKQEVPSKTEIDTVKPTAVIIKEEKTMNIKKTGSFFANRKENKKPKTPSVGMKRAEKTETKSEAVKKTNEKLEVTKDNKEKVKVQAAVKAAGSDDQTLKDEVRKLREEAALLRKKNEEAELELRKRRAEENKARAAEKAKKKKERLEQKRLKKKTEKAEKAAAKAKAAAEKKAAAEEKAANVNNPVSVGGDEKLLKPGSLQRGKTVRPPPGFVPENDPILNTQINNANSSLNFNGGGLGANDYSFMNPVGNNVNNLNVAGTFDNGNMNMNNNTLNFGMDLNNNQKVRSRSGSGNNGVIGRPSPSIPSQSNDNINQLNFNLNGNSSSNTNNTYNAFGGTSLFDNGVGSISTSSNAFGGGFGDTSYLSPNNSAFPMDLPNVNALVTGNNHGASNQLAVDDDDEEILLMASNPSFGNSSFGGFGSGSLGGDNGNNSNNTSNNISNNLSGDVRKKDKKKPPPGFNNVNGNKW
jgi:hypothetical protein